MFFCLQQRWEVIGVNKVEKMLIYSDTQRASRKKYHLQQ